MSHVLVTGGCGFFGTWIIRKLLADSHRVTVVDVERSTRRWEMALSPDEIERIAFVAAHIDEPETVAAIFQKVKPDAVIHLAGLQVPTCRANPLLGAKVNVIGTLAVFEAAAALPNRPAIAYASSAAVFGSDADYDNQEVGDHSSPRPGTHYGAYKLCNEYCARAYYLDKKIRSVGFRPLTVYGPGRDVGMTSFPTRALAAAILKKPFDIPFKGPTAYTYVEEVAEFFVAAALKPVDGAPAFTVGGDVLDVPAFIAEAQRIVPGAANLITCSGGDLPIAAKLDDNELRKAYPAVKRIGIADGIRRTVEVFKRLAEQGRLEV
jgi:nucleoside-diphosphate-sugar epimerase